MFSSISSWVSVNFSEESLFVDLDFWVFLGVDFVVEFGFCAGLEAGLGVLADFVWVVFVLVDFVWIGFASSIWTKPPQTTPTQKAKHKNLLAIIFYPKSI